MKKLLKTLLHCIYVFVFIFSYFLVLNKAKSAAYTGSFQVVIPNGGNLVQQCTYSADIRVNTGGINSNAANVVIVYDPSKIDIIDANPNKSGKQIAVGTAYQSYAGNLVDENAGKIQLTGFSSPESPFNGNNLFATLNFKSKPGATSGAFIVQFDGQGATLDSNIASASDAKDILSSVENGNFNLVPGTCVNDKTPPNVIFNTPTNNQSGVSLNQDILITLTDNLSGIDLSTLQIIVNGVVYIANSPEVKITGTPNDYTLVLDPKNDFYPNAPSSIVVYVKDYAGNSRQSSISFNFPVQPTPSIPLPTPAPSTSIDLTPPVITYITPISQATIRDNSPVIVNIADVGTGVNLNSIIIFVNEKKYTIHDSTVTYTSNGAGYTITINDNFNFPKTSSSYLSVFALDNAKNSSASSIIFNIPKNVVTEEKFCLLPDTSSGIEKTLSNNIPLTNQINNLQTRVNKAAPQAIKKIISDSGILGLISVFFGLPVTIWLIAAGVSFLFRLLPFLASLLTRKSKKYGQVLDSDTKSGIPFAMITILDKNTAEVVKKIITVPSGKFFVSLDSGHYRLEVSKKNYKPVTVELDPIDKQVLDISIQMTKLEAKDLIARRQLDSIKLDLIYISVYLSVVFALLNLFYIKSALSVIIMALMLMTSVLLPGKLKKERKLLKR